MSETLGVGLIGYGFMGRVHEYCYRNMGFFYDPSDLRVMSLIIA